MCVQNSSRRLYSSLNEFLPLKRRISRNWKSCYESYRRLHQLNANIVQTELSQIKEIVRQSIELIIKYCNNLTHFAYNLLEFVDEDIQMQFFEKFGHKLMSADIQFDRFLDKTAKH